VPEIAAMRRDYRRFRLAFQGRRSYGWPADISKVPHRGSIGAGFDALPREGGASARHHVRLLKAAGLARSERDGKMVMYELTDRCRVLLKAVAAQGVAAT
jgi:hypothetical protein